ncbi:MAG: NAD(P)/FAD-dependent oxidoreductase [bacterium]|nr:NAD(P)/FAD-dependent oxidoreductase [bacterium]
MYDCIVIGAGPAGCTAAKILAENKKRVLLVEKFRMPRYKSCSGVLIKKSMDLVEKYFGEAVPDTAMCTPTNNRGMIFTNDKGEESTFAQEGLNVWRESFDHFLAMRAMESGAEVRDYVTVIDCKQQSDSVTVTLHSKSTYTEETKYVIDCEGVVGAIKRKIMGNVYDYITTYQTFNKGFIDLDLHYFYAYLQPELSEYDAWFNVKDDMLVLGVSVKNTEKISEFYRRFIVYMEEKHGLIIKQRVKEEKWLMPHIHPGCKVDYGIGRIFFAGEIAGFLNPMGEGISSGMESGYCVAQSMIENFDNVSMVQTDYERSVAGVKSYMERQWSLVAGMSETFAEMR